VPNYLMCKHRAIGFLAEVNKEVLRPARGSWSNNSSSRHAYNMML
jgi:hypothetical protein